MKKAKTYAHLGFYSDLVSAAQNTHPLFPMPKPGPATRRRFLETLAFEPAPAKPRAILMEQRWEKDGIAGEKVTWDVGYGPRTEAWVLRPAGVKEKLPGVIALHDHGGFKYFGKEKIADGPTAPADVVQSHRDDCYGGRAWPNALAREGFTVLVPDVFLWGSRKFPLSTMVQAQWEKAEPFDDTIAEPTRAQVGIYERVANNFEHVIEKYCTVLGTTLSGIMSYEDRIAAAYLMSRDDVKPGGIGCAGLSGGGLRSCLLQATCTDIRAAVIVGLMSTYEGELDRSIFTHTWACFPRGWSRYGDWPDIAACRAPSPLLVQYDIEDNLFTLPGMKAAHLRLQRQYRSVGKPRNYTGRFYPGPHKFDLQMQADAFTWLAKHLR